jgi:hypothetical protein
MSEEYKSFELPTPRYAELHYVRSIRGLSLARPTANPDSFGSENDPLLTLSALC